MDGHGWTPIKWGVRSEGCRTWTPLEFTVPVHHRGLPENKETPPGPDRGLLHGIAIDCWVCIKRVADSEFVQIVSVEPVSILLSVIAVFGRICQVNDAQNAEGAV